MSHVLTNQSTETALAKIVTDITCNLDLQQVAVLVLMDLSAAFEAVDPNILLNRLRNWASLMLLLFLSPRLMIICKYGCMLLKSPSNQ